VLVKHEGKILAARGLGMANIEHDVPNSPQTKFRIGSISKSFTALLVLQQVDAGKLKLDDPISQYLEDPPEAWKPITIHHLLCHTSGIFNYTNTPEWLAKQATLSKPEKLVPIFRDKPLQFAPGEKHEYSNSGYILLGQILKKVTGKNYEQLVREHIAEPLDMRDTGYDHPDEVLAHRAAGYRHARGKSLNARFIDMASADAAGAIYSTVEDLSKYDDALTAGKLLSAESYAKLFTPVKDNYAYGWVIEERNGKQLIWHNGGINGFASSLVRRPDTRSCVVVLSNYEDGPADRVSRDLMALLQGNEYTLPRVHVAVTVDPARYDALAGKYQLAPQAIMTITREGNRLMAQLSGQPKLEAFPESETEFFYKVVDAQLSFVKDEAGQAKRLVLHQNGMHLKAERLPDEPAAKAAAPPAEK
jgi:CubicO group peptidase (beta-lactamase class C family)